VGRGDAVAALTALQRSGLAISIVSCVEVLEGVLGSQDPRRGRQALRTLLRHVRVLVLSRPVAERAAAIRLDLRRQKRQVNERSLDILVAATAIQHRLTLVTRNTRDYADIPGIVLYPNT
jgi:predicted nucleic acid-binding protein